MSNVIVECGSSARGDTNQNSDIDYVCIWSGTAPDYSAVIRKYRGAMFYSIETIRHMRAKGSLFLTHLDIDSVYKEGDKCLLTEISGYRPPKNLVKNLLDETSQFISEIGWYPDSSIGRLWLCDVLYVALRNCIYCRNALNGKYVFGYEDSLDALRLSPSEYRALLTLREGKYNYRKRTIKSTQRIDTSIFHTACAAVLGNSVKFFAGGRTQWIRNWRKDYWGERLIERAILNREHVDNDFLKRILNHNYHKRSLIPLVEKIVKTHLHS